MLFDCYTNCCIDFEYWDAWFIAINFGCCLTLLHGFVVGSAVSVCLLNLLGGGCFSCFWVCYNVVCRFIRFRHCCVLVITGFVLRVNC